MARNGIKSGGRKAGTLNKKTIEEIDRAARVLNLIETKYLEKDIAKLTANQRMILYADMMEYKAPKLSRATVEHSGELSINWLEERTYEAE